MITYNKFQTEESYNAFRYDLLLWLEETGEAKNLPYLDGRQIPTMGIGFNLRVTANRNAILQEMGFDPSTNESNEKKYIDRIKLAINKSYAKRQDKILQANLDKIMADWVKDTKVISHTEKEKRIEFRLENDEIEKVLNRIAPEYEKGVDKWINANGLSIDRHSYERAALFSLAYNSPVDKRGIPKLLGHSLKRALKDGNRIEANYEIALNSNLRNENGVAKRRLMESIVFGLFDNLNNVTKEEKERFVEMIKNHKTEITEKEALFGRSGSRRISGLTIPEAAAKDYGPFIKRLLKNRNLKLTSEAFLAFAEDSGKSKSLTKSSPEKTVGEQLDQHKTAPVQAQKEEGQQERELPVPFKIADDMHKADAAAMEAEARLGRKIFKGLKGLWGRFDAMSEKMAEKIYFAFRPAKAGSSEQHNKAIRENVQSEKYAKESVNGAQANTTETKSDWESKFRKIAPHATPAQIERADELSTAAREILINSNKSPRQQAEALEIFHRDMAERVEAGKKLPPVQIFDPKSKPTRHVNLTYDPAREKDKGIESQRGIEFGA